jgi:integrase/recombinase XerD
VRLHMCDLDNRGRILRIRESKGRSRDLPFRADLAKEFTGYLRKRAELLHACGRDHETALFVNRRGRAITVFSTSQAIRRLLRRLGMKSQHGCSGPRPYDLRHAFAVHRLTAWYHEGADLQERLPWLSAYMGHLNLLGTEIYLHATPELLDFASKRFAHLFKTAGDKK